VVGTFTNTPSLSISNLTAAQAGDYTVTVANFAGSTVSSVATIGVVTPVVIQQQPVGTNSIVGRPYQLIVGVAGDGPIGYQWRLNGLDLASATNAILDFPQLNPSDAGIYTVQVRNAAATVESDPAIIAVSVPPGILIPPQSQIAATGTDLQLEVLASGTEPWTFQWIRGGIVFPGGPNAAQLHFPGATPSDSGEYQVIVLNAAGSVTSSVAVLQILDRPSILTTPVSVQVPAGGPATFSVIAGGGEPLVYQWLRHGTNLPGATNAVLKVAAATASDADFYLVRVSNPVGSVQSDSVTLTVNALAATPEFEQLAVSETGFSFRIRGTPGATYRIEGSSDLESWSPVQSTLVPAEGVVRVELPIGNSGPEQNRRFLRARAP
jgi:hypothetical protein